MLANRPARRDSWPVSAAMQKTLLTRRNVLVVRCSELAARRSRLSTPTSDEGAQDRAIAMRSAGEVPPPGSHR